MRRSTRETTMASSSGHGEQREMAPKKQQQQQGKRVKGTLGAGRAKPRAPCTCQLEGTHPSQFDTTSDGPFEAPSILDITIAAAEDSHFASASNNHNINMHNRGKIAAASGPGNSSHNAAHPPQRRSRRKAASKVAVPPTPVQHLASSSSLPWSVRVNDDASHGSRAFVFPADSHVSTIARGVSTPPNHPLLLAPFLFDSPGILDVVPLESNARRCSSLPARWPSPLASPSTLQIQEAVPIDLQDWLLCTSPAPIEPSADGSSSSSYASSSANSRSNSGSSSSTFSTANTAATSLSSKSHSGHSSPTSSQEGCCNSSTSDLHSHNVRSSPLASKRPSEALMEETPKRLKKLKLSHRIRSFLLLRPPGLPLTGTDGAADIAHIMRAPSWLKNATSELSRESRMAPNEWVWSCNGHNPSTWTTTTLERKFRNLLKSNMAREDLEREERDGLSPDMPIHIPPYIKTDKNCTVKLEDNDGYNNMIFPTSPVRNRAARIRLRQVSAPPKMEAESQQIVDEAVLPPKNGIVGELGAGPVPLLPLQSTSSPPPEVLKSQLLAVLRSRLPEGAKNGDAPLRMKKFVVWNAWIRRATLSTSRSRYRRRSMSPVASAPLAIDTPRSGVSLSPPSTQDDVSETLIEPIIIDTSIPSIQLFEDMDRKLSEPSAGDREGESFLDTPLTLSPKSSALGLMMHDETARTARRFSRAFESDGEEDTGGVETDFLRSDLAGPFISTTRTSEDPHASDQVPIQELKSLLVHSPSPAYSSSGGSQYSGSHFSFSNQYPSEGHRYSSTDNDFTLYIEEDKKEQIVDKRPMSPLRARMELQASTLTPPSFSADLAGDNYAIPPLHYDYNVTARHREDQGAEDAAIVPFWFDQECVTFDDDEDKQADHEGGKAYVPGAEQIETLSQELGNSTSYRGGNPSSDDWPQAMRTRIAA